MNGSKFYSDLTRFVKAQDNNNANRVIMTELGNLLIKDKADFIEVIRGANINVPDNATDIQLVNAFVDNAPSNRKLLLGASFLINHKNQTVGFDGEEEISDAGVKATYKVMHIYFDASKFEDTSDNVNDDYYNATGEEHSNIGWSDAVKGIVDVGGGVANNVMQGQRAKKYGATDTLAKQTEARKQMVQTVMAQRQAQADAKNKEKEHKAKTTRTLLIVGGVVVLVGIVAGVIYAVKKSKGK